MKREDFIQWAESRGWKIDRFGHLRVEGSNYRYKLSSIAVRYEIKLPSGWVRLRSGYFSKLSITPDGKLAWPER